MTKISTQSCKFIAIVAFSLVVLGLLQNRSYGQHEFTNNVPGDNSWNNAQNWDLAGMTASSFPDNGASAIIPLASAQMSTPILLTNLDLTGSGGINLGGQTLTVNGTFDYAATGGLVNGTLETSTAILTGVIMSNARLEAQNTTLNGGLALTDGSEYHNVTAFDITGNFGISGPTGLVNTFINSGTFSKSGGGGFSDVSPFFTQGSGDIEVTSGVLRFTGDAEVAGGGIAVDTRLIFAGPTTIGSPTIALTNNGYVECLGFLTLNGILTSSGNLPGLTRVQSTGGFSGGDFRMAFEAPFLMLGGSQDSNVPSTNSGAFFWDSGTLYNFTNNATSAGDFSMRSLGAISSIGLPTLAGRLTNNGYARQDNQSLLLATNGVFDNRPGATFEFFGGTVTSQAGATGQSIENAGEIVKDTDGVTNTMAAIAAPLHSTGTIRVLANTFLITGPAELTGDLIVDRTSDANAKLELGASTASELMLSDINFDGRAGGLCDWRSGQFTIGGDFTSTGDSGTFHIRGGGVDVIVPQNGSALFDFTPQVPVLLGANNNQPELRLNGSLVNSGHMIIYLARVLGPVAFRNTGDIYLQDTLDLSSTSGSDTGIFRNNGLFDISTLNGSAIRINQGGFLLNGQPGGIDADLTGGSMIIDGNAITSTFAATSTQFLNQGSIVVPTFSATISAVFEQDGSNSPSVEAQRSALTFNANARFANGIIRSSYLDFATDATPSVVQFNEDTRFGAVTLELANGGQVLLSGSSDDIWTLESTLTANGMGRVRMTGGVMVPDLGLSNTGLHCPGDTLFRLEGGLLNAPGEVMGNTGNLQQTGGTVRGSFTNGGLHDFDGGNIDGAYANTGAVEWSVGTATGTFSNGIPQTENVGTLLLLGPSNSRTLAADSTLSNWHLITQESSLTCGSRAKIAIHRGTHVMRGSALVGGQLGAVDHVFEVNALGTLLVDSVMNTAHGIGLATFGLNGGRLETKVGNLIVNPMALTLDGGALVAATGTRLELNAQPTGTGVDSLVVNGVIEIDPPSTTAPGNLTLRAGGKLTGGGTLIAALTQEGALLPGNSPGTLTIDGSLTQSADALTEIEIAGTIPGTEHDVVNVSGALTLGGALRLSLLNGYAPTAGQTFTVITAAGGITGAFNQVIPPLDTPPGISLEANVVGNSVVITAVTAETYDDFAALHFTALELADSNVSGPYADPNANGIANVWEWLLGNEPKAPGGDFAIESFLETESLGNFVYLRFPWRKAASGVTLGVEAREHLVTGTWDPVSFEVQSAEDFGDFVQLTLRIQDSTGGFARRFFQLTAVVR